MRFALLLLFALCAWSQPDVRKAAWGMTADQVRSAETGMPTVESKGALRYPVSDFLKTGSLEYIFRNDRLERVIYTFATAHEDLDLFITDFQAVTPRLVEKHGKTSCERVVWFDDSLQIERMPYLIQDRAWPSTLSAADRDIGLSLSLGHLQLMEIWEGSRTQIAHTMTGSKGHITHRVEYRSAKVEPHPAIDACKH
jgi:hypothetical protein